MLECRHEHENAAVPVRSKKEVADVTIWAEIRKKRQARDPHRNESDGMGVWSRHHQIPRHSKSQLLVTRRVWIGVRWFRAGRGQSAGIQGRCSSKSLGADECLGDRNKTHGRMRRGPDSSNRTCRKALLILGHDLRLISAAAEFPNVEIGLCDFVSFCFDTSTQAESISFERLGEKATKNSGHRVQVESQSPG